eukprot:COSAG02_NODE_931_length_15830_cov_51.690484_6_plen_148_part_00
MELENGRDPRCDLEHPNSGEAIVTIRMRITPLKSEDASRPRTDLSASAGITPARAAGVVAVRTVRLHARRPGRSDGGRLRASGCTHGGLGAATEDACGARTRAGCFLRAQWRRRIAEKRPLLCRALRLAPDALRGCQRACCGSNGDV